MTFFVAQLHVPIALWMFYAQENKTKKKTKQNKTKSPL
jgi:hypothetical protein